MKEEYSAGCIAYKMTEEGTLFALILDRFGKWSFPKGHIEEGESAFAAARRELSEEIGLDKIELTTHLGVSEHCFRQDSEQIRKWTEWFLVQAEPAAEIHPADNKHVKEAKWMNGEEALACISYKNIKPILALAKKIVASI